MNRPSIEETIQYIKDTHRLEGLTVPEEVIEAIRSGADVQKVIDKMRTEKPWRKETP